MTYTHNFEFDYPITYFTGNRPQHFTDLHVEAIAYLRTDGSLKTIDIDVINYEQCNLATFLQLSSPELYEQLQIAAQVCFQDLHQHAQV